MSDRPGASSEVPPPPQPTPPPPQPRSTALPPPPPEPVPPAARQTITLPARESVEWAAMAGAAALVLGSFMTWASAGPFKAAGTDGDGWFTILLGAGALVLSWNRVWEWSAVLGVLGLAIVVWKFLDLASLANESSFITVSPGAGLFVCGIGAAVHIGSSLFSWLQARGS